MAIAECVNKIIMRNELKSTVNKLKVLRVKVEKWVDIAEGNERQECLENELEQIDIAIDALEEIE